jgi:type 1 glutamine amidotransferase/nicotinamidase-related amidase
MRWVLIATILACPFLARGQDAPLNVCLISGSFEYDSDTSLSCFKEHLESHYAIACTLIKAEAEDSTQLSGLEALDDCDVALFYMRRLPLEGDSLDRIKAYCEAGRPLVAVRTASHGVQTWLEFDQEVLGGNYRGHFGAGPTQQVNVTPEGGDHPILDDVGPLRSRYSLYKTRPVAKDVTVLMTGTTPMVQHEEPLSWVREHRGGRVFYTSLGGLDDFEGDAFRRMLANALFWAAQRDVERKVLPEIPPRIKREGTLTLSLRTQTESAPGAGDWREETLVRELPVAETALLLCDMWDKHWCDFASDRVAAMAPQMNEVVRAAREAGIQIVHAPSDTLGFYQNSIPRRRMQAAPAVEPKIVRRVREPRLPIDDSDGGCPEDQIQYGAWTRQQPAIEIYDADGISDNGREVYNLFHLEGIRHLIIMGVHTNMCVLGRSFGIRQMTRWGIDCILVRDLTDTMYNPAMPPYVPHDTGTDLVVEHIEKYWCPSVLSAELLAGLPEAP